MDFFLFGGEKTKFEYKSALSIPEIINFLTYNCHMHNDINIHACI